TTLIGASGDLVGPIAERDGIMMCFRNDKESKYGKDLDGMVARLSEITSNISRADTTLNIDPYYLGTHRKESLRDFLSKMARHKLVITDRYHGTIFSVITNTPVIVLGSTDHKLSSGVKWFSDKAFSGMVYYAESPRKAVEMAQKLYGRHDYSVKVPPVFNEM